jgi:hypothetical protein
MIKKIVTVVGLLVLGATLAASPALAANPCKAGKKGVKGCKNEIQGCAGVRTCKVSFKGKPRKQCNKACKTETVTACQADNTVCSASPSGAFLD